MISKETFLKALDAKNRDAMLYDMLEEIAAKISVCKDIKKRVDAQGRQLSFLRGIGVAISTAVTAVLAWLGLK